MTPPLGEGLPLMPANGWPGYHRHNHSHRGRQRRAFIAIISYPAQIQMLQMLECRVGGQQAPIIGVSIVSLHPRSLRLEYCRPWDRNRFPSIGQR